MKFIAALLILICSAATAQDTTYVTYEIQHDTLIETTIPEQIYIGGYDTTIDEGAVFNGYYNFQIVYPGLTGNVTVITPDYDTIPEHDTVFVCTLCATHDTTVMVIMPVEPEEMIYGMFPNPGNFTPFAQRLNMTKEAANTAFRDNYDAYNSSWKVEQVHDSALLDLMTYNAPECCHEYPFPTGSELTRQLNALDSTLTANADHLPDIISFNNEEPNKGYWSGLPSDYTAWLNAATAIAHNHGIPVSNGGVLQNIIWYIRWVYQQEGKTDSVEYINARTGYGPTTLAFQQLVIDWYKIEMPALMASNIDYINFHWYEPTSLRSPGWQNPESVTSASGLLPVLINFLGRYGRPVITTEFGTGNDSHELFNEVCNQIKDAGVKVMVYYAGDGPLANNHTDWWRAFILQ